MCYTDRLVTLTLLLASHPTLLCGVTVRRRCVTTLFPFLMVFGTPPPTDQNIFITFSTSNTTTAHTQMGLLVVGVQGHQKTLENSKTLKKIDVFACLVVQVPGVPGGGSAPPDPAMGPMGP